MKETRTTFPIKAKHPEVVTDCKSWKEGEQKNPRGMQFFIRTYHGEDVIKAFLGSVYVDAYSYIYHDKDTYPDGKPKEPHYHLLVKLSAQVSLTAIVKAFQGQQTYVQLPYSLPHAYRYLVHADNPDKHQYPAEERVEYKAKSLQLTSEELAEDKNKSFVEDLENNLPMRELAIKYGRDYMKNSKKYSDFISDMHGDEATRELEAIESDIRDSSIFELLGLDYGKYCIQRNGELLVFLADKLGNCDRPCTWDLLRDFLVEFQRDEKPRRNSYIRTILREENEI